ncbi:MAG: zf-HC2 domain-containing protein [Isosphaeraceae bacterium]
MNLDEVTYLTAYLDGALDPEQRSRVEAALMSDTRLADQLRELTAVRNVVAGLSRPQLRLDLSSAVLARLAPPVNSDRELPRGLLGRPAGRAAVLLATAASLLLIASATVVGRAWRFGAWNTTAVELAGLPGRVSPSVVSGLPSHDDSTTVIALREGVDEPRHARDDQAETRPTEAIGPDARDRQLDNDRLRVRQLLDSPSLRTVYVVTDVIGGNAPSRVGEVLSRTPRKNPAYVCLTITSGEVVDPSRPGAASVFAVVVDPMEQGRLQESLNTMFPERLSEERARPETLTMLADVGQVSVLHGKGVGDVFVPEEARTALQNDLPTDINLGASVVRDPIATFAGPSPIISGELPASPGASLGPLTASPPRAPDRELDRPDAPLRRRRTRPELAASSVVLVWVQHANPDGARSSP